MPHVSRIGSWERELAKWAPGLAVLPYIGGQAARDTIQRWVWRATAGRLSGRQRMQASPALPAQQPCTRD
jgi:hypothetical protein